MAKLLPEQGVMHIITRENNRQTVFRDDEDFKKYLFLLRLYQQEHRFKLYHYCLMSNHVHLIIETMPQTDLPKLMKQINLTYMYHFRKKYKCYGHFWQDRCKSLLIDKNEYLMTCGKYVELNPVRAKIVSDPSSYKWSSYSMYAGKREEAMVDFDPLYEGLGKTQQGRAMKYERMIAEEINLNKRYIGSEEFVKSMEEKYGVANVGKKKGRPLKAKQIEPSPIFL